MLLLSMVYYKVVTEVLKQNYWPEHTIILEKLKMYTLISLAYTRLD